MYNFIDPLGLAVRSVVDIPFGYTSPEPTTTPPTTCSPCLNYEFCYWADKEDSSTSVKTGIVEEGIFCRLYVPGTSEVVFEKKKHCSDSIQSYSDWVLEHDLELQNAVADFNLDNQQLLWSAMIPGDLPPQPQETTPVLVDGDYVVYAGEFDWEWSGDKCNWATKPKCLEKEFCWWGGRQPLYNGRLSEVEVKAYSRTYTLQSKAVVEGEVSDDNNYNCYLEISVPDGSLTSAGNPYVRQQLIWETGFNVMNKLYSFDELVSLLAGWAAEIQASLALVEPEYGVILLDRDHPFPAEFTNELNSYLDDFYALYDPDALDNKPFSGLTWDWSVCDWVCNLNYLPVISDELCWYDRKLDESTALEDLVGESIVYSLEAPLGPYKLEAPNGDIITQSPVLPSTMRWRAAFQLHLTPLWNWKETQDYLYWFGASNLSSSQRWEDIARYTRQTPYTVYPDTEERLKFKIPHPAIGNRIFNQSVVPNENLFDQIEWSYLDADQEAFNCDLWAFQLPDLKQCLTYWPNGKEFASEEEANLDENQPIYVKFEAGVTGEQKSSALYAFQEFEYIQNLGLPTIEILWPDPVDYPDPYNGYSPSEVSTWMTARLSDLENSIEEFNNSFGPRFIEVGCSARDCGDASRNYPDVHAIAIPNYFIQYADVIKDQRPPAYNGPDLRSIIEPQYDDALGTVLYENKDFNFSATIDLICRENYDTYEQYAVARETELVKLFDVTKNFIWSQIPDADTTLCLIIDVPPKLPDCEGGVPDDVPDAESKPYACIITTSNLQKLKKAVKSGDFASLNKVASTSPVYVAQLETSDVFENTCYLADENGSKIGQDVGIDPSWPSMCWYLPGGEDLLDNLILPSTMDAYNAEINDIIKNDKKGPNKKKPPGKEYTWMVLGGCPF